MKTLHLIRHAKSSWDDPKLVDHERPLNARGVKACRQMAQPIFDAGCDFSRVYCSTAQRAQLTIQHIRRELTASFDWELSDDLYTFNGQHLLEWCQNLDEDESNIVLVGHNPALTEFCHYLSGGDIHNIPTCGYAQLRYEDGDWCDLSACSAELEVFLYPKMFR